MKHLLIIVMLLCAVTAYAQPPRTMNFQGTLAEADGTPLANGIYGLEFRVWTADVGGTLIWDENVSVTLEQGIFSTILGKTNPLNLPFDQPYWLGVAVGGDPELTPRSELTGMPYAMNVADGAVVKSLNGLKDDVNLLPGANVSIVTAGPNITISATGALADNDWDVDGANMTSIPAGNVGIGQAVPMSKLHVLGDIAAGNSTNSSQFISYNGTGYTSVFGGDFYAEGSEMLLREDDGDTYLWAQPDFDGTGGFFQVDAGNGSSAFRVDGNASTGENAVVSMFGNSSVLFNLGESENSSVQLPGNSIAAPELLDEPGLASNVAHGSSSFSVPTSNSPVTSRTITVPTDGYLLAIASCEVDLRHEEPGASFVTVGLSLTSTTLPASQDHSFYMPSVAPAGLYLTNSTPTAMFEVTAGSHTVYMLARRSGTSVSYIWDTQLTLLFIPTAYGTTSPTFGTQVRAQHEIDEVSPMLTAADIADERFTSIRTNEERMERELEALRAEVAAIKAMVGSDNGNQ